MTPLEDRCIYVNGVCPECGQEEPKDAEDVVTFDREAARAIIINGETFPWPSLTGDWSAVHLRAALDHIDAQDARIAELEAEKETILGNCAGVEFRLEARIAELEAALRAYYDEQNRHAPCPCDLCNEARRALGES